MPRYLRVPLDKAAKAVERASAQVSRYGRPIDPKLVEVSKAIRANPQSQVQILEDAKLTPEVYSNWVKDEVNKANSWMSGI